MVSYKQSPSSLPQPHRCCTKPGSSLQNPLLKEVPQQPQLPASSKVKVAPHAPFLPSAPEQTRPGTMPILSTKLPSPSFSLSPLGSPARQRTWLLQSVSTPGSRQPQQPECCVLCRGNAATPAQKHGASPELLTSNEHDPTRQQPKGREA